MSITQSRMVLRWCADVTHDDDFRYTAPLYIGFWKGLWHKITRQMSMYQVEVPS